MPEGSQRIIACPRCKARQPVRPICEKCGFDIKAYVLAKHRPAEEQTPPSSASDHKEHSSHSRTEQSPPPQGAPARERVFGSVEWLFGTTWDIYKRRWLLLLGVIVGGTLASLAGFGLFMGLWYLVAFLLPMPSVMKWILSGLGVIVGTVLGTGLWGWVAGAMFEAAADEEVTFTESFGLARQKLWAYVWLMSISGFIIVGGYCLFLIPGIIFTIWFWYAPYILAVEDSRGMTALIRSREYVRGQWWGTFLRLLLLMLCQMAVNIIPFVGPILGLAFMPFTLIYAGQAYRSSKQTNPEAEWYAPTTGQKFRYIALGILGYVVAITLVVTMIAGAVRSSGFSILNLFDQFKTMDIEALKQGSNFPSLPGVGQGQSGGASTWQSEDGETAQVYEYARLVGQWDGMMKGQSGAWSFRFLPGQTAEVTASDGSIYTAQTGVFFNLGVKPGQDIRIPAGAGMIDFKITATSREADIGKVSLGVFKIEGERLTLCASAPGIESRPATWEPSEQFQCFELTKTADMSLGQAPGGDGATLSGAGDGNIAGEAVIIREGRNETYKLNSGFGSDTELADPSKAKLEFSLSGPESSNPARLKIELDAARSGIHAVDGDIVQKSWMGPDILPVGTLTPRGIAAKAYYIAEGGQVFFPAGVCTIMIDTYYTATPDSVLKGTMGSCMFHSAGIDIHIERMNFIVRGYSRR